MNQLKKAEELGSRDEWKKAAPEELPDPTYWPFFLAMAFAFLLWGIVAGLYISIAGLLILIIALTGWIKILRREVRKNRN